MVSLVFPKQVRAADVATYGSARATYRELLDAADHALYEAKAGGGDRVA